MPLAEMRTGGGVGAAAIAATSERAGWMRLSASACLRAAVHRAAGDRLAGKVDHRGSAVDLAGWSRRTVGEPSNARDTRAAGTGLMSHLARR